MNGGTNELTQYSMWFCQAHWADTCMGIGPAEGSIVPRST